MIFNIITPSKRVTVTRTYTRTYIMYPQQAFFSATIGSTLHNEMIVILLDLNLNLPCISYRHTQSELMIVEVLDIFRITSEIYSQRRTTRCNSVINIPPLFVRCR